MSAQKYEIVPVADGPAGTKPVALRGRSAGLALKIEVGNGEVSR